MGKKSKKALKEDLVLTLDSGSEADTNAVGSDSDAELDPKRDNKQTKEINPNFEFSLDGFETVAADDGWEFRVAEDDSSSKKKDVNLDNILRRKGGLSGLVEGEGEDKDDEDKDEEDNDEEDDDGQEDDEEEDSEEEDDEEENDSEVEDDDELALDGFGMGVPTSTEGARENKDEEENVTDIQSAEVQEAEENESENESENEQDSAEAMAKFYEQAEEIDDKSKTFQELDLSRPVLKGLSQLNYSKPSPIQAASIPIALLGKDIVAGAVTGSGKTGAFMIPIIERLLFKPSKIPVTRVIVLTPTRELAIQVCDVAKKLGRFIPNLTFGLAVGGLNLRQQEQQLKSRPDIVVATPGRLIDHIRNSASFSIDGLEILVLDEADRMLDEGFHAELTEILSLVPKHKRQTMLFSATMNTKIQDLIQLSLNKPVRIMIDPPKAVAAKLVQEFVRIRKKDDMKPALLYQLLKESDPVQQSRVVVFVSKKETAHRLRIMLGLLGMKVSELHGSLSQDQRLSNVSDFKNLTVSVLICTDLAARGLDIPKIEMVINFDMPKSHEVYLHRVGRTARAGREGRSITLVGESAADRGIVKAVMKSLDEGDSNQKAVSRSVKWDEVEKVHRVLEQKMPMVDEVLEEEKAEKQMLAAEMDINKAENLLKHEKDIYSKPKRTWFESEKDKRKSKVIGELTKSKSKPNSKKRKQIEARRDGDRIHKKTKRERLEHQGKSRNAKTGKKSKKK